MHVMKVPLQGKKKHDWVLLVSQVEVELLYDAVEIATDGCIDAFMPLLKQLSKASTSHESTVEDSKRAETERSASDPLSDDSM